MLLNLNFIPEIIQKVCLFVCLFISLLLTHFLMYHCYIQNFSERRSCQYHIPKYFVCSTAKIHVAFSDDGPTLGQRSTVSKPLTRNCYLSTMMAQRWPNVLYPTPTFADRTNQFPTLGQRMSAIWEDQFIFPLFFSIFF